MSNIITHQTHGETYRATAQAVPSGVIGAVYGADIIFQSRDTDSLRALAAALLEAARLADAITDKARVEADRAAAAEVNVANAETDSAPFGTMPARVTA